MADVKRKTLACGLSLDRTEFLPPRLFLIRADVHGMSEDCQEWWAHRMEEVAAEWQSAMMSKPQTKTVIEEIGGKG